MKISEVPALKEARDDLARKICKRKGGDYIGALNEANAVTRRTYRAARATKGGGRRPSEEVAGDAAARAGPQGGREQGGPGAGGGAPAAGGGRAAAAAPDGRPLHELGPDEFADRFAEAVTRAQGGGAAPGAGVTEAAAGPVTLPGTP